MNLIRVIENLSMSLVIIAAIGAMNEVTGQPHDFTESMLVSFFLVWVYRDSQE